MLRSKLAGHAPIRRAVIKSLATYVPPRLLTNADLEKLVDTTDEWIMQRTGIRERHIVDPGVATSDLAKEAALEAISRAGLTPADIDLIIVGTVTPDMLFPSTACLVQDKIGATKAWGFDLSAACSAFTYALTVGSQMVAAGARDQCAGDRRRRDVEHHRLHRPGDLRAVRRRRRRRGAGRVGRSRRSASSTSSTRSTAAAAPSLCMPAGGSLRPASQETVDERLHFVKQEGQAVFKFAVRNTGEICERLLQRNGVTAADLDLFVSHQANRRIIMSAAERIGMPEDKVIINIDRFGNTTAATIPLALNDAMTSGRLKKGDLVLLASVGAGFTVGSVLVRWGF